jgi:cell division protein FtsI/penicillin-binding protein 2
MSKTVKLKISDLEKIVKNVLKEAEFDDFDTKAQPEELPDYEAEREMEKSGDSHNPENIVVGKDQNGNIVVMDTEKGEILGMKKL